MSDNAQASPKFWKIIRIVSLIVVVLTVGVFGIDYATRSPDNAPSQPSTSSGQDYSNIK